MSGSHRYRFRVVERLSATVLAAFPELEAETGPSGTWLAGPVRDACELHGLLDRFLLMGITVVGLEREAPRRGPQAPLEGD